MKESIEMQNEFEEIIQELKKLKSTNENLSEFKKSIGLAAESLIEVDKKTIELFQRSQVLIGSFDEFIEKYKSILEEQIDDLKREIRDLKKLRKELDIEGIVTAAKTELSNEAKAHAKLLVEKLDENLRSIVTTKTELIDTLHAKTETLLEELGGLGVSLQGLAEQADATHQLCAKEFPALSEKVREESTRLSAHIQAVQANTQAIINTIDQIDFPAQFRVIHSANTETKENLLFVKNELSIVRQQMSSVAEDLRAVKEGQLANRNILDAMNQRLLSVETHQNDVVAKLSESQKAQRLQFIIVLAVVVVFGIVLLLK